MADLFDRLFPVDDTVDKIPIHQFHAGIVDYVAGETTFSQIVTFWGLDSEAQIDLTSVLATVDGLVGLDNKLGFMAELESVSLLAEIGAKYTTKSAFKTRLGI